MDELWNAGLLGLTSALTIGCVTSLLVKTRKHQMTERDLHKETSNLKNKVQKQRQELSAIRQQNEELKESLRQSEQCAAHQTEENQRHLSNIWALLTSLALQNEQQEEEIEAMVMEKEQQLADLAVITEEKARQLAAVTKISEDKEHQLADMIMVAKDKDQQLAAMRQSAEEKEAALLQKITQTEAHQVRMEGEFEKVLLLLKKEMEEKNFLTDLVESHKMSAQENLVIANESQKALEQEKRESVRLQKKMLNMVEDQTEETQSNLRKIRALEEKVAALALLNKQQEEQFAAMAKEKEQQLADMAQISDEKEAALLQRITQAEALQLNMEEQKKHLEEDFMKNISLLKREMEQKDKQLAAISTMAEEKARQLAAMRKMAEDKDHQLSDMSMFLNDKDRQLAAMVADKEEKEQVLADMAKYIEETEAALLQKLTRAEEIKISMEEEHEKKIFLLRMEMEERENSLTALVKSQKMVAQENLVIANKSQKALEQKRKPSRLRKNKAQTMDETLVALIDQSEQKEQQLAVVLCDNAEKDQQLAVMAAFADKKEQELAEMTINAEEKKLQLEEMAMVIEEKDRQISDMAKLIKEKEGALLQLKDMKGQRPASVKHMCTQTTPRIRYENRKEFDSRAKEGRREQAQLQGDAQQHKSLMEESRTRKTDEMTGEFGPRQRERVSFQQENNEHPSQRQHGYNDFRRGGSGRRPWEGWQGRHQSQWWQHSDR